MSLEFNISLFNWQNINWNRIKLLITLCCLLAIYLLGNYGGMLEGKALNWWSDFFWTTAALLAAWRSFVTAKKRSMLHERKAWYLFGLAALSWFVGMLIWDYYEIFGGELVPFPSTGDWFFMGYAVFFIAGLFFYRTRASSRQNHLIQFS